MTNSLPISVEIFRCEAERALDVAILTNRLFRQEAARDEALIMAYLAEHPGVRLEQLRLRRWYDGRAPQVEIIPAEEMWLNWQSDNHGWARQDD